MPKALDHRLARIEELSGFAPAEGEPDVRGWEVISRDGQQVGEVTDLLVDTENPSVRYLEVRLSRPAGGGHPEARPTGNAVDVRQDAIPELDSLSGQGGVIGQAAVPGHALHEMPARTIGEALVRDSLLDIENRMTSGGHPGFDRGEGHVLIPVEQARIEPGRRQVQIDSLPAASA